MKVNKIAEKLANLRNEKGISQSKVAKDLGLDRSTICAYEAGTRIPSDENKIKLAKYFKVSIESIFFTD